MLLAQRIVRDIEQQGLGPGQMLPPERSMMDAYETGRGTLRESLRFLELQGILTFRPGPGGGPMVRKPTADMLATSLALLLQFDGARHRELLEARSVFEPRLAQLAAGRISAEQLSALRSTLEDMEAGLEDQALFLDADRRFHRTIAWASGNSLFGFLIEALVEPLDVDVETSLRRRQSVLKAHRLIHQALSAADGVAAGAQMNTHLDEHFAYAAKKVPDELERPVSWQGR
nr:FCD domain-containing protein [Kineosporia babensis]